MLYLLVIFFILLLFLIPVEARDAHRVVPTPDILLAEFFYPDFAVSHIYHSNIEPHWIKNDTFWYSDNGKDTTMFYLVNASQCTQITLFNTERLAAALADATGKKVNTAHLPISDPELSPDLKLFSFSAFGDKWSFNLSTYRITKNPLPDDIQNGIRSPDRQYIAYVNGSNLWLYDTRTFVSSPLTTDGTKDYFYGKRSDTVSYPVTEAVLNESPEAYLIWSPDSSKIQTFRIDQRNVSQLELLQDAPGLGERPVLYSYRFANPGDPSVPMYEPITIDINTKKITKMQFLPQPEVSMMDTDLDVLQWWNSKGNITYTLFLDRGEKTLRLLFGNPDTGGVEEILNESGETYIESNLEYAATPNIYVLEKTGDIIWFSERDGWGHLYRYDANGTLKNQVTKGPWVVRKILAIDEARGVIYFTGSGREVGNPYYRYLYQVKLDGSDLQLLTPEQSDHEIFLSPDNQFIVDAYSRVELPTVTDLKSIKGSLLMHLATADDKDIRKTGWTPPEQITFKARDGKTDLYGLVFKPTDFNEKKDYPVIDVVYPGPYTIVTETKFPSDLSWNSKIFWTCQMISELGYIVVTIDGLGTAYRSKAFHNVSYGHLSDCGLPDHIIGITGLASKYKYMNLSRVGMYGKSAGGFMTAQAMLTYPRFFKVGVAASGDQDCRLYGSYWGEKYEGYPVGDYYNEQVTALKAGNLSGDLLLMTGDMDDNVHPAMTMQLADALEKAGKQFDMYVFPNKNHDLNYDPYYLKKMMNYFVDNL